MGPPKTGPDSDAGFAGTVWDVGGGKPLLSVPMGRQSKIFTITGGQAVFSPNDRQLLVLWGGGGVGTARTWAFPAASHCPTSNTYRGSPARRRPAHRTDGGFAPNGTLWINQQTTASFRYGDTLQQYADLTPGGTLDEAGFAPDGRLAVTVSRTAAGHGVRVWETARQRPVTPRLFFGGNVARCVFSPDGTRLAVSENVRALDYLTQVRESALRDEPVFPAPTRTYMLAFGRDGRRAVFYYWPDSGRGGAIRTRLVDVAAGTHADVDLPFVPSSADFSPDGSRVAVGGWGQGARAATFAVLDTAAPSRW